MILKRFLYLPFLFIICISSNAQIISGKVVNKQSQPIAGASIHLLNTHADAISDTKGGFVLKDISAGKYAVSVTALGYASKQEELLVKKSETAVTIQLVEASIQLDEVMVTAQKREESLVKIPQSITAVSANQVLDYRLWDLKDLTAIAPNLNANNSGDGRNVTSIRGIVNTSYDQSVATYIDGVNQFNLDTYISSLSDIERIEILRGPQGTLYGRNAMGGVINIVTKQPSNKETGFAEITIGDHGQQRYQAGIRMPLIKNKLFFGASGLFNKRDGFYSNSFTKSSFENQEGVSGNYFLRYLPNANWELKLNVKFQNNRNDGTFPLVTGVAAAFKNPFQLNQNALATMIDNTLNTSLLINKTGKALNFSSITAWQKNHRNYSAPLDADFSPVDAITIINDYGKDLNNVQVFTQEFRLASPTNTTSAFKWTAGSYFFNENAPSKQATHFGKDAGLLGIPSTNFATINTTTEKNSGIAFYGQGSLALGKNWDITAGLRYDNENKKMTVKGEYQKDGGPAFVTRPDTTGTTSFSTVLPKMGLSFQAAKNTNLFASYSIGYKTGGLTQLSSDPSQPPLYAYKPEYSHSIEAGIKNILFNQRVHFNFTVFVTNVNDVQVPTLVLPDAITVTKNTGKLSSKGVELELMATPVKGLHVDYNLGYTNASYTNLKMSQNGTSIDLSGNKQLFTPDMTSMLAVQYGYAIGKSGHTKIQTRFEWKYLGNQYFDLANKIMQGSYNLINLRVGITTKHYDVFLWNRNAGNIKYIAYAYDFGGVHLGDPSTFGTSVSIKL